MEDDHAVERGRRLEAADLAALLVGSRVAVGGHDHGHRRLVVPAQVQVGEHPVGRGHQRRQQVRLEARHQHLALRVAEADVELDQLGALLGDHQPGVEHALVRLALGLHGGHGGRDDLVHDPPLHLGRHYRRRGIGAHAAGVRPGLAVADPLVVLRRGERQHGLAVDEREEAGLLAVQEFLDDQGVAGRAELFLDHDGVDGGFGLGLAGGHRDPLAGGQAVGLDHDRDAGLADEAPGGPGVHEAAVLGGRHAVLGAEVLHETLGAFEHGRRGARAEGLDAFVAQAVDQAGDQRRFGPDHDEVDGVALGEGNLALDVFGADRHAVRFLGDPGVAGGAKKSLAQRRGGDLPAQGVLAPAAPDNQDLHAWRYLPSIPKVVDIQAWRAAALWFRSRPSCSMAGDDHE